jgi:hypothetical protein
MRFHHEARKEGDKRIVRRFLLIPITIGDETRWLESASFVEEWQKPEFYDGMWVPVEWKENE